MKMFEQVSRFHREFGLPAPDPARPPALVDHATAQFRLALLREELRETEDAVACGDLPDVADGLVDLVYVALGTAIFYNLPWEDLFDEVQRANMRKCRARRARQSRRASTLDVVKPADWRPPDIKKILRRHGWRP